MPTIADDLGLTCDEWSMVREICQSCASEKFGAEDLEQEAAVELFEKRAAFAGLEGWNRRNVIRVVVRNRALNVQRGEHPETAGSCDEPVGVTRTGRHEPIPEVAEVPLRPWLPIRYQWILERLAEGATTRELAEEAELGQRQVQRLVKAARETLAVYWEG